jgi:hypothetical protein
MTAEVAGDLLGLNDRSYWSYHIAAEARFPHTSYSTAYLHLLKRNYQTETCLSLGTDQYL